MSTEPKFTKGPWSFDGPLHSLIVWGAEADTRVCFMTSDGPSRANAHLIAVAPELYEFLSGPATSQFLDVLEKAAPPDIWSAAIRFMKGRDELLAKARGETPSTPDATRFPSSADRYGGK